MLPHWEHGYRCHGYWFDVFDGLLTSNRRIGWVGLEPYRGGFGNVKDNGPHPA